MRLMRSNSLLLFTPPQHQLLFCLFVCLTPRHRVTWCVLHLFLTHIHTNAHTHTPTHNPPTGRNPSCAAGTQQRPGIHIPFRLVLGCILYARACTQTQTQARKYTNVRVRRHRLYLNERRSYYCEGDSRMKPTHQGLTCGSGAAAARRGAALPALIRGLHHRGCSRWRRWKNQLIKRHCRLSSAAIWKESFLSFIYIFFFTHCLFVSLLCFLCPLPRQRCRWIGAVSVRDLCVISWNVHPSKHKKLHFQLFELYSFFFSPALFHWHSASLLRSKPCFMVET